MSKVKARRRREVRVIADCLSFLEGPRSRDGQLYTSDFYTQPGSRLRDDGSVETVCTVPGQPSGLGFDPKGRLLVVSMTDRRLLRLDPGGLTEVADLGDLAAGHCNDMIVDKLGRAYVGNFGFDDSADPTVRPTVLIRVDPDGTAHIAAVDIVFPNGTVIAPDGKTLLISETFAARISAFHVAADGSLSKQHVWAELGSLPPGTTIPDAVASGFPLPDGMALDAEGAVWIGDAAESGALRFIEGGEIVDRVVTNDLAVFAVALGGAVRRTLYMCVSPPLLQNDPSIDHRASLRACRVDVPGIGLP